MDANQLTEFINQVQRLWETHVPAAFGPWVPRTAVGMLVLGIGMSVLGAKLARFGATLGFAAVGVFLAMAFASRTDWPVLAVGIAGAVVGGGMGYALIRLWVGLAAAAFFSAVALATYGSQTVVPHFLDYEPAYNFDGTFALRDASGGEAPADVVSDVRTWARDFWLYVQSQEADVNGRVLGIGLGAGLVGLLLGALLPRFTLIVVSSVAGTALVMSGLAGLATQFEVDLPYAVEQHGTIVASAGSVFLLASLILQTLLTRKAARPAPSRPSS